MCNPEIGFAVTVDEKNYQKAKTLADEGFSQWLSAGQYVAESEYFDEDDAKWIHDCGWSEPSAYLLDKAGIENTIESCFDDDGEYLEDFDASKVCELV